MRSFKDDAEDCDVASAGRLSGCVTPQVSSSGIWCDNNHSASTQYSTFSSVFSGRPFSYVHRGHLKDNHRLVRTPHI